VQTRYDLRSKGRGPRGFRVGSQLRFRQSEVDAWLARLEAADAARHPEGASQGAAAEQAGCRTSGGRHASRINCRNTEQPGSSDRHQVDESQTRTLVRQRSDHGIALLIIGDE
jgi:hypothetical protein